MDDSEKVEIAMHLKDFEEFIDDLNRTKVLCERHSIRAAFNKHLTVIKDLVLSALSKHRDILVKSIDALKNENGKKYVSLEKYERKKMMMNKMEAEKNEICERMKEFSSAMPVLMKHLAVIDFFTEEKINPSECGIPLVGLEILKELTKVSNALPIYAKRSTILQLVKKNQFVVLKGETGSGKSTQLAQYILSTAPKMRIICTQPRKVAAVSLAKRIAKEQFSNVGESVGYWVGMNKCYKENTKLLLMTDRMLLNHCLENPNLDNISCVIIDEAHERSTNIDLLLGMVKAAAKRREDLKVIVTSATISTKLFSDYFHGCPVIEVPGHIYPVDVIYEKRDEDEDHVKKAISKALEVHVNEGPGDILIFLTTPLEVENAVNAFKKASGSTKLCTVLPLHGKVKADDQMKVFEVLPNNVRKVVFSTNVAETSVTIPGNIHDLSLVDACLMVKNILKKI